MDAMVNTPQQVLAYRFTYDDIPRIVDNVSFEGDRQQIIGFEMRKGGKFSYRVKRYTLAKISDLSQIDPPERSGPKIGRPDEAGR